MYKVYAPQQKRVSYCTHFTDGQTKAWDTGNSGFEGAVWLQTYVVNRLGILQWV